MAYIELSNPVTRARIFKKYGGKCAYCGCKLDAANYVIDHIQARVNKGPNVEDNFNPACKPCNTSKSSYTLEQWRYDILQKVDSLKEINGAFRTVLRLGLIKVVKRTDFKFYFEKLNKL